MKNFFIVLTVVLAIVGFFVPIVWVMAVATGIIAIGTAPSGTRPDGKRKSGGLLGPLFDNIAVGMKMRDCPYCKNKIMNDATKCPHCHELVTEKKKCVICGNEFNENESVYVKTCSEACQEKLRGLGTEEMK